MLISDTKMTHLYSNQMGSLGLCVPNYKIRLNSFCSMRQNVKWAIFGQFLVQNIFLRFRTKNLKITSGRIWPMGICAKSEINRSRGF